MVSELKSLHPYLYRRVWLKGVLFLLLGLSSVFATQLDAFFDATRPSNAAGLSQVTTGSIFIFIGTGILVGLYGAKNWYKKISKKFLYMAFAYALFWEVTLVLLAFTQNISTVSIFILWGYLVYNLGIILSDTGWAGAEIVRKAREKDEYYGS